jgi:hypothetical protein
MQELDIIGSVLEFCMENHKFQYLMTKTFRNEMLFGFLNFGHWDFFDICDLIFVISGVQ